MLWGLPQLPEKMYLEHIILVVAVAAATRTALLVPMDLEEVAEDQEEQIMVLAHLQQEQQTQVVVEAVQEILPQPLELQTYLLPEVLVLLLLDIKEATQLHQQLVLHPVLNLAALHITNLQEMGA
jgi:hypothetical protein